MATLKLGVHEMPYAAQFAEGTGKRKRTFSAAQRAYGAGGKTTGMIASILEARYGIMQAYYDNSKSTVIIPAIERSVKGALINVMMGQPGTIDIGAAALARISEDFKQSLSLKKYDEWLKGRGVPTLAALRGVSHRFKQPYKRRSPRPSFIDTGLYQSSFVAWM